MTAPDLSVAVFAGGSAVALHATLMSVERALLLLRGELGMTAEVVLVCPPGAAAPNAPLALCRVDCADAAAARGAATSALRGRFGAFLDAGDMWSGNFLTEAVRAARRERGRCSVWRPEAVIGCGLDFYHYDVHCVFQPPILDAQDGAVLLHECPYASSFFADRTVFDAVRFPQADHRRGWLDIDAWWTAEAVGKGFGQRILEGTALYRWSKGPGGAEAVRIGPSCLFGEPPGPDRGTAA